MASVVFIIRVPFEDVENSEAKKEEKNDQTNDGDQGDETAENDVEILTDINWAEVLQNELRSLKVQGDSWKVTQDKKFHQVMFFIKSGERVEKILERLTFVGIGKRLMTSISIISTSVHIQPEENIPSKRISKNESTMYSVDETEPLLYLEEQLDSSKESSKESMKDRFKKSIKSRLTVKQVVESVRLQGTLTFDFVMFTILASIIATVGLAEDNAVMLVASVLLSPLMGPILGATFGTVIKNESLRNTGLKTELCGLIISAIHGFLFGFICGPFGLNGGSSWNNAKDIWPTQEMTSRGMLRGLWVGVLIALPSGAAVALSVMGGNIRSLVGVTISASLLLPAVNSGMLFAYSIVTAIKPPELLEIADFNTTTLKCPPFKDNTYDPMYSCEMTSEAAVMAIISLALTILNIICIFIAATIMLKVKEVAPMTSSSNATQTFWTKDIKVAREAYATIKGDQAQDFLKEWRKVQDNTKEGHRDEELLDIIEEVENAEEVISVVRRAPRGTQQDIHRTSRNLRRLVAREDVDENIAQKQEMNLQHTLRNLQTLYTQQSKEKTSQPHVGTIFSKPQEPSPKPKKSIREFHVVETENPHHTSVVRVQPPDESSNKYSVTTECGV